MRQLWTRRQVIAGAALAATSGSSAGRTALASVTLGDRPEKTGADVLVLLFLRGGADGLNVVVPYADADYYRLRPSLGLPGPRDLAEPAAARALDLNGFFGLHPALAPLLPAYRDGHLLAVHAVGSGDQTRSHFEAMATVERGLATDVGEASGWLARHLNSTAAPHQSPLRAVAFSDTLPDSLRGAATATALHSAADYHLAIPTGANHAVHHGAPPVNAVEETLRGMYSDARSIHDPAGDAGMETLAALDTLRAAAPERYRPAPGIHYPAGDVGGALQQVAALVKARVGLEVACLDVQGWDTHVAQGRDTGWQASRLAELGGALAAFAADLGPDLSRVTAVTITEFGRRAYENTGLGTDHGRASVMLLLGGGVKGGRVFARWPGLRDTDLDGPGDLRVTTDYRDVLAEVVTKRLHNLRLAEVFPQYSPQMHGLVG